ncbi:unnamed protein product [Sphenostylis stenocarpa]|uniref:Uncharacterized protein n=1 Tax=Sphenostylis stenocarpa TaxID=92480 RepID=A0AA86TF53_9FABA|nr:unnamed protein product [Sphenostylis stenocarpa]
MRGRKNKDFGPVPFGFGLLDAKECGAEKSRIDDVFMSLEMAENSSGGNPYRNHDKEIVKSELNEMPYSVVLEGETNKGEFGRKQEYINKRKKQSVVDEPLGKVQRAALSEIGLHNL